MKQNEIACLAGNNILFPDGSWASGRILMGDGKIAVIQKGRPRRALGHTLNAANNFILPGFIDLQVNGVGDCDLAQGLKKNWDAFSLAMAHRGVTSFLPTLISAPAQKLSATLKILAALFRQNNFPGARPLGIHLEGPFLNSIRRGIHPQKSISPFNLTALKKIFLAGRGAIKMWTFAPELDPSGAAASFLTKRKILAAMGHTDATYRQAKRAIAQGYHLATHLFNAMRPWHHRDPGLVGAVLDFPEVVATLIPDTVHVDVCALEMALRLKGLAKVALVSDELVGAEKTFTFASLHWQRKGSSLQNPTTKILPGSSRSLLEGIALWSQKAKRNWWGLVPLATITPSRVLGIAHQAGSIQRGKRADLIVLSPDLKVLFTLVAGKVVYKRG